MQRKITWIALSIIIILSLVLTSCAQATTTTTPTTTTPTTTAAPTTTAKANWWDKLGTPQYGGEINYRVASLPLQVDPANTWGGLYQYYGENTFEKNWTTDRKEWAFQTSMTSAEYWMGNLVKSWEWSKTDPTVLILHVQEGVKWQNKPPLNGREFVADDIQQHFDRNLGTGSGYTKPNPFQASRMTAIEKVVATGKYTAEVHFKAAGVTAFFQITEQAGQNWIEAPEIVKMEGGFSDWKYGIGTGPWMLADFLADNKATFTRNPDYWGTDPRYPGNRVPYAEKLNVMCIPDLATALSALRTGKIDFLSGLNWQQAAALKSSNPEILQTTVPNLDEEPQWRCDTKPFTDINVRKALNMAIDRPTMAKSLFGGSVDGKPAGLFNPALKGWCYPYDEWPQSLKDEYSYKPDVAKKLLADAGYPNGFKTNCITSSSLDLQKLQAIQGYLKEINVEMEIKSYDPTTYVRLIQTMTFDQMCYDHVSMTFPVQVIIHLRDSNYAGNMTQHNDPAYDVLSKKFDAAATWDEAKALAREADKYSLERHWQMNTFPTVNFFAWQPNFKGYSGELISGGGTFASYMLARLWKGNK